MRADLTRLWSRSRGLAWWVRPFREDLDELLLAEMAEAEDLVICLDGRLRRHLDALKRAETHPGLVSRLKHEADLGEFRLQATQLSGWLSDLRTELMIRVGRPRPIETR